MESKLLHQINHVQDNKIHWTIKQKTHISSFYNCKAGLKLNIPVRINIQANAKTESTKQN